MYKIPFRQNGTCTRFARQTEIRWMAWHRGVHNFNIASLPVFNCLVLYWRRVSLNLRPRQLRLQFDQWVLAKTVRWSVAPLPFLLFDCGVRMSDSLAGERDHCTVDGVSRPLPVGYLRVILNGGNYWTRHCSGGIISAMHRVHVWKLHRGCSVNQACKPCRNGRLSCIRFLWVVM